MNRIGIALALLGSVTALPCGNASAAVYYEVAPDLAGNYDLKISVSPTSAHNWVICSSKGFSQSGTDTDRDTTSGSNVSNSAFDYFWPSTMVLPGGGTMAVRTGSGTGASTTYRAINCGTRAYTGNVLDVDPNGPLDDRFDLDYDIPRYNVDWGQGEVTVVKLGSDFTGHATGTKGIDTSIPVDCSDPEDLGKTPYIFDATQTFFFDYVARTKADCKWYVQVTKIHFLANPHVCTANHSFVVTAPSHDKWCAWECINQNYPQYYTEAGNADTTCTQIHENYHANEQLADALAAVDPYVDTIFTASLPIVCDTRESESQAKSALQSNARAQASAWAAAVGAELTSIGECPAYNAEASCNNGLSHTDPSPGACNACSTYGLTATGC